MRTGIICYFLGINLAAFLIYGIDKYRAKRAPRRRIPERDLLCAAALGGSLGALLAMRAFHHKTRHRRFAIGVPCMLAVQLLAAGALVFWLY